MYIGSGETSALLSGINSKTHHKLLQRFVSDEIPVYNAKATRIDAFRAGAILEERFYLHIGDKYLPQYKVIDKDNDCCKATLDFAEVESNVVIDFIELKTAWLTDYQIINMYRDKPKEEYIPFIRKKYKDNYNQVQYQLMCSGLQKANLCYLEVQSYEDEDNYNRVITPDEYVKFEIERDEYVISEIRRRVYPFQVLKNYYKPY